MALNFHLLGWGKNMIASNIDLIPQGENIIVSNIQYLPLLSDNHEIMSHGMFAHWLEFSSTQIIPPVFL